MRIEDHMKTDVISIGPDRTVREAATLMVEHHIGTLPVVDEQARLIGLLTIGDVLRLFMPDFVTLLSKLDFVSDFGRLEERAISAEAAQQSVRTVMQAAISVERSSGLLRAFAEIHRYNLLDLPIVDEADRLVGIASRTDIGTAFLGQWLGVTRAPRAGE